MIEQIVITALLVLSIWYSMQEGEIFGFVTKWGEKHLSECWQQPIFACNVCMSPYYGSIIYWVLGWLRPEWWSTDWVEWPVVVIGAMGINAAINKLAPDK